MQIIFKRKPSILFSLMFVFSMAFQSELTTLHASETVNLYKQEYLKYYMKFPTWNNWSILKVSKKTKLLPLTQILKSSEPDQLFEDEAIASALSRKGAAYFNRVLNDFNAEISYLLEKERPWHDEEIVTYRKKVLYAFLALQEISLNATHDAAQDAAHYFYGDEGARFARKGAEQSSWFSVQAPVEAARKILKSFGLSVKSGDSTITFDSLYSTVRQAAYKNAYKSLKRFQPTDAEEAGYIAYRIAEKASILYILKNIDDFFASILDFEAEISGISKANSQSKKSYSEFLTNSSIFTKVWIRELNDSFDK